MTDPTQTPDQALDALVTASDAVDEARATLATAFGVLKTDLESVNSKLVTALSDLNSEEIENEVLAGTIRQLSAERDALIARINELEENGPPTEPTPPTVPEVPTTPPVQASPRLPWAIDYAAIWKSGKKIFGHYFSPNPLSLDNKDATVDAFHNAYNATDGENGKWTAVRGYFRDRPEPVVPWPSGVDWKLENAKTEILAAVQGGLTGFWVNVMGISGTGFGYYLKLAQAADILFPNGGFYVSPMLDTNGSGAATADKKLAADRITAYGPIADAILQFAYKGGVKANGRRPSAWFRDGKFVMSSFKADGKASDPDIGAPTGPFQTADRWDEFFSVLRPKLGVDIAFIAGFLDISKRTPFIGRSWLIGAGDWGSGTDPALSVTAGSYGASLKENGLLWMAPVSYSAVRNAQRWFDEQVGTRALRYRFKRNIQLEADMVQVVTVNDFAEGSHAGPSAHHGRYVYDLIAGLAHEFVTGQVPTVVRDAVYVSYRNQLYPFKPSINPTGSVIVQNTTRSNRTPVQNVIEVLTYLTAPARVTALTQLDGVEKGRLSWDAPAGEFSQLVPLTVGEIRIQSARPGADGINRKFLDHRCPILVMEKPLKDGAEYMLSGSLVADNVFDPQQEA